MKRIVLLNAPVLTSYGSFEFRQISVVEAKDLLRQAEQVESAIGHQTTAEVMTKILDFEVKPNRIEFFQTVEDTALIFKLKKRIGEGQVLTAEEIETIGFEFGLMRKIN